MVKVTPLTEQEKEQLPQDTTVVVGQDSDSESEVSDFEDDADEDDYINESLSDRLSALKDVIPPQYRSKLVGFASSAYQYFTTGLSFSGKAVWIVTTSSLLLGVPLSLSIVSEQQLIEMEKEMKLSQSTNELLAPGAEGGFQQPVAA